MLFELADGKMTMIGFVVPNRDDVPTEIDAMRPFVREKRRSIAEIERMAGFDLFGSLPASVQNPMEASTDACIALPKGTRIQAVSLLWPDDCRPQSWTMPTADQRQAPAPPAADQSWWITRFLRRFF